MPEQITDASSEWVQKALLLLLLQPSRLVSFPLQDHTLSHCPLDPWPKAAPCIARMAYPYPSCRQTTSASAISQESSQIVCHSPLRYTSTRPSYWLLLPTRRILELPRVGTEHTAQLKFNSDALWHYIQHNTMHGFNSILNRSVHISAGQLFLQPLIVYIRLQQ